jgi:uncharacterized paraquat-inducible protein A
MAIAIQCPSCTLTNTVPDDHAGLVIACEYCQESIWVPERQSRRRADDEPAAVSAAPAEDEPETCVNHPNVAAAAYCHDCTAALCPSCQITFQAVALCARCKNRRAKKLQRDRESSACAYASLGVALPTLLFVCFGILLGPIAVVFGLIGLHAVEKDPLLRGRAWAIGGLALGVYSFLVCLIWFFTLPLATL